MDRQACSSRIRGLAAVITYISGPLGSVPNARGASTVLDLALVDTSTFTYWEDVLLTIGGWRGMGDMVALAAPEDIDSIWPANPSTVALPLRAPGYLGL